MSDTFFNRDLSWLSFNQRVLTEAASPAVPLMERIRFLSIFSANLDEFYRVRMPGIIKTAKTTASNIPSLQGDITAVINQQLNQFGSILNNDITPLLAKQGVHLTDYQQIPTALKPYLQQYFFTQVAGFIQVSEIESKGKFFFPENNQLYLFVAITQPCQAERYYLVNIPTSQLSRFIKVNEAGVWYIIYLEDVVRMHLHFIFSSTASIQASNIKITRDAAFTLPGEYGDDLAEKIEERLASRDNGLPSRLLYPPDIPLRHLFHLVQNFNLFSVPVVQGGYHHNLKDLAQLPVQDVAASYPPMPALQPVGINSTLFDSITMADRVVHTPYQSYNEVLRFFNEAAISQTTEIIYTTLYRVASDSRIVQALMSAAKNGKKVMVLVELKARFDEANNIKWAKKMKEAGVKIIYSNNAIKVHAKIALVKRRHLKAPLLGLLATGNLNETTARFYTDHILLTAHQPMLLEMEKLFCLLQNKTTTAAGEQIVFNHLMVAQFNLHQRLIDLIDQEIVNAKKQLPASIIIKINNLEEEVLINKLYEASAAGVTIQLIVRSICRLIPGVPGLSEHITVKRIVDRFLEHGRLYLFHNNGNQQLFLGSADWMNRNIYDRIEVCFPVYDAAIKQQLLHILQLQCSDNQQAVYIDAALNNVPVVNNHPPVRSQEAIYNYLAQ
jgi:polyphosphate kinase